MKLVMINIFAFLRQNRLRWYGHVLRKADTDWVKKCMEYEVGGLQTKRSTKKDMERGCAKIAKHVI